MLTVFGGLPGTGKTAVSRALASRLGATHLRVDAIEQAIRDSGVLAGGVGPAGYAVAQAVAAANLSDGRSVVADCANPVAASRDGWRAAAARAAARLLEVEVVCSDVDEHRRRVTTRAADIAGLVPPSFDDVLSMHYEPWTRPRLVVDTARLSVDAAVDLLVRASS